jgi:hypothetical protein
MIRPSAALFALATTLFFTHVLVTENSAQGKPARGRGPSLKSDLPDYGPGEMAQLTGTGFFPNEQVTLQVLHANGTPATGEDHDPWTVTANNLGRFVTTWHVCEDDCINEMLVAFADGNASGQHAEVYFFDSHDCGTGVVTSVVPVGSECSAFTPAVGNGPDNYEVQEGGTYVMTIDGVTECTGDTITVFIQSSSTGNFCFNAVGGSGTYVGTFTLPNPACNTMPVSYKCGAGAPCNHPNSFSAQGPTSGCGNVHLRASIFDGNCNRTGSDTDCTPPAPEGACCLVDGTCVEVTEADCATIGGTYQGDDTHCGDIVCPPNVGACCLPIGTCIQVSEADCLAQNGTYNGDLTMCKDIICPPPLGACCLIDGSCVEVEEEDCATLGGFYNGDLTTCASQMCEQPHGACCLPDGSCVEIEEDDCLLANGQYQGDWVLCGSVTCDQPEGACCLADGSCIEVEEEDCVAQGGTFHGDFSLCVNTSCPQPCLTVDFSTEDDGITPLGNGQKLTSPPEFGVFFNIASSGANAGAAIFNTNIAGPNNPSQDRDLLVNRGNALILQNSQVPGMTGDFFNTPNDDQDGGNLIFNFINPVTPQSVVLIDIDAGNNQASTVTLKDSSNRTRTYTVPSRWTEDILVDGGAGWRTLDLTVLTNQPGFMSTATASQQSGFDATQVIQIVVHLGSSGAVDDLSFCY